MTTTVVLNPKITAAGQAAAIAADGAGLQLAITHVAFGTGAYDPIGTEVALQDEVKRVTIPSGAMVTPTQARITAIWESETDNSAINEIGFFAGATLFAVWSRSAGGPLGYKTPGVDFVLFHDLKISGVPAGSIAIQVEETAGGVALAALGAHEAAPDPHAQYVLESAFPDAQALLACAVGGTANAITLTPPTGVVVAAYSTHQKFSFIASADNTGAVTVNVAGKGVKAVKKNGSVALDAGDIKAGAIYEIIYDGTNFQLAGGVGGGAGFATYRYVATAGQTAFTGADADGKALAYTVGLVLVWRAGALVPFTGTDGTTITLGSGAVVGDEVVIVAFSPFSVANALTQAAANGLYARLAAKNAFTSGNYCEEKDLPATTGTVTLDLDTGVSFGGQITGNITMANPANMHRGQSGVLRIVNDAATPRTIAWGSYWKTTGGFLPSLTASPGATDLFGYYVESATRITVIKQENTK